MKRRDIKYIHKKLGKERAWGRADDDRFIIEMDERLKGKKHLEIAIHESFHLLFRESSEEEVIEKSIILTNLLWKMGYRRVDDNNNQPLQDGKK